MPRVWSPTSHEVCLSFSPSQEFMKQKEARAKEQGSELPGFA